MTYRVYSPEMLPEIEANQHRFIFLEEHRNLRGHWEVNSFDPAFVRNLDDVVDAYSSVTHLQWPKVVRAAEREGYEIVFMEDPEPVMKWLASLDQHPGVELDSDFEGTVGGLLPFQRQAVNFAKPLRAAIMNMGTGTGKSSVSIAWTKWLLDVEEFDCVIHVVKKNNLKGIARKLAKFAHIVAAVMNGTPAKRDDMYEQFAGELARGERPTIVLSYNALARDSEVLIELLSGLKVGIVWDEMPSKLRNRTTKLYRGIAELLYTSYSVYERRGKKTNHYYPRSGYERFEAKHLILTATPIYNSPADVFAIVRMCDPEVLGSITEFERKYVRGIDPWGNPQWDEHKLPLLGAEIAFMTFSVDKTDPEVAQHFPEVDEVQTTVELGERQQYLYDVLQQQYADMDDSELSSLERKDILGAINIFQLICSAPESVLQSAKEFEDWLAEGGDPDTRRGSEVASILRDLVDDDEMFLTPSAKLAKLVERLEEREGRKTLVFTRMNETVVPTITRMLDALEIPYETYTGTMTDAKRQKAIDRFRADASIEVMVLTDAGQDSIDLPEADYVIHYDRPWTAVVKTQRQNRAHRLDSLHDLVTFDDFECKGTYEERVREINERKRGYDEGVFGGKIADASRTARRDMLYALTGKGEYLD